MRALLQCWLSLLARRHERCDAASTAATELVGSRTDADSSRLECLLLSTGGHAAVLAVAVTLPSSVPLPPTADVHYYSGTLSVGAIIGIAIGAAASLALLVGLFGYCQRRQPRRSGRTVRSGRSGHRARPGRVRATRVAPVDQPFHDQMPFEHPLPEGQETGVARS